MTEQSPESQRMSGTGRTNVRAVGSLVLGVVGLLMFSAKAYDYITSHSGSQLGLMALLVLGILIGVQAIAYAVSARRQIARSEDARGTMFAAGGFALGIIVVVLNVAWMLLLLVAGLCWWVSEVGG